VKEAEEEEEEAKSVAVRRLFEVRPPAEGEPPGCEAAATPLFLSSSPLDPSFLLRAGPRGHFVAAACRRAPTGCANSLKRTSKTANALGSWRSTRGTSSGADTASSAESTGPSPFWEEHGRLKSSLGSSPQSLVVAVVVEEEDDDDDDDEVDDDDDDNNDGVGVSEFKRKG